MKRSDSLSSQPRGRGQALIMVGAVYFALFGWATLARAEDTDILQIKQTFEPGSASVVAGQTLNFVNSDDVNHNLQLVAPGGLRTDFGVEKPGETTKITFAAPGEYAVVCGIHPRMKMKVQVSAGLPGKAN